LAAESGSTPERLDTGRAVTVSEAKRIDLTLSVEQALVLFDWVSRFNEAGTGRFEHQAEQRVLWDLEASLEAKLVAPLDPKYSEMVANARAAVCHTAEASE
jgi:hypothetical protein